MVLLAAVSMIGSGCGSDPPRLHLEPGLQLLRHLDRARLLRYANTNLPPAVAAAVERLGTQARATVAPTDWTGGVPPANLARIDDSKSGFRILDEGTRRWLVTLPYPLDLPWMSCRILVGGKDPGWSSTSRFSDAGVANLVRWYESPRLVLWWDSRRSRLTAFSAERPEPLEITWTARANMESKDSPWAPLSQAARSGQPLTASDLARRFNWRGESRAGLLLPAPGVLAFDVTVAQDAELRMSIGVSAEGLAVEDGLLLRSLTAGDGVNFAVDVLIDGAVQRLWSQMVVPGTGWHQVQVPLTPLVGRRGELRLVTETGPAGIGDFDYAAMTDLGIVGPGGQSPERPHVVLIDVDTLRPDRMSVYGHDRNTTPRLDTWASERAVVYTNALANSSWTLPSTVSMLTGLDVHQHGVSLQVTLPSEETPLLAERLSAAGYETLAITGAGYVSPPWAFDRGFDTFLHRWDANGTPDWQPALDWLDHRSGSNPVFLYLHTYAVHAPYIYDSRFESEDAPYAGALAGKAVGFENVITPVVQGQLDLTDDDRLYVGRLYDAGVARADEAVGNFLEDLFDRVDPESCLVILVSDHGEELFDHGSLSHGRTLWDEQLRIPFIVQFPGPAHSARVDDSVSLLDVVPTVLDVIGLAPPTATPGRSLLGPQSAPRVLRAVDMSLRRAVQFDGYKLLLDRDGGRRLFHLAGDPAELTDLATEQLEMVSRLMSLLEQYESAFPPIGSPPGMADLDAEALEGLRALGY